MPRLFIGIFVPEDVKSKILKLQQQLVNLPMQCKPVEKENLHITLSFLGETSEEQIPELKTKLDTITQTYQKFATHFTGLKLIPNPAYIRVIALEAAGGSLMQISQHVKQDIGGDAKPPHLTLCRVKNIQDRKTVAQKISEIKFDFGEFTVESIDLIQSDLEQNGPVYTSLHKSFLR